MDPFSRAIVYPFGCERPFAAYLSEGRVSLEAGLTPVNRHGSLHPE